MPAMSSINIQIPANARVIVRTTLWVLLAIFVFIMPDQGPAYSTDIEGDALLKSTYNLNFAKLVEWSEFDGAVASDRFMIGICGDPY